ncbi:MAG: hypothetical protein VKN72_07270 [Nostocales cyanobacterium 94392]|nr:hypothetical protein [Nostocales cyanobacterium 94392]
MNPILPVFAVERAPPATFYKQVTLRGVTINNRDCTHSINQLIAGENND